MIKNIFGIDLFYEMEDTGKQKVLFIHGFKSSSKFIDSLWEQERDYDIVAIDLPGYGKTEFNELVNIRFFAEILEEFIKEMKLKDLVLFGHSMGGAISMILGRLSEVKSIILLNPLNPYTISHSGKKTISLSSILPSAKINSKKISKAFEWMSDYRRLERSLIKNELLNKEWQSNELYVAYKDAANKACGINSKDDQIISEESIHYTSKAFGIIFKTIGEGHSPIKNSSDEINKFINKKMKG